MRPSSGTLRYFGCIRNGTTPATGESEYWDGDVLWATPEDLGKLAGDRISQTKRRVTEKAVKESNLSVLPADSVIISTRAPIGHMAINDLPMAFNQGCRGITPGERVHGPFLYYTLKYLAPELNAMANGTTFAELSRDELAAVPIELPLLATQRRIAQFLDEKTARIDALIAKKQELLGRLAEKRQALITQAVTKGLNPDAPMKSSGINWLGDIPKHWEVKRLGHIAQIILGVTYSLGDVTDENNGIFVIRASNIQNGKLVRGDDVFAEVDVSERKINRIGDIVVCSRNGSRKLIGKNAMVSEMWEGCTFGAFMTTIRTELSSWVHWVLASTLFEFQSGRYMSTTINQLTTSTLKSFPIPIPPKRQADKIAQELRRRCSLLDTQYELVVQSIENLTEYRAALITAAVTGQVSELR